MRVMEILFWIALTAVNFYLAYLLFTSISLGTTIAGIIVVIAHSYSFYIYFAKKTTRTK